MHPKGAADSLLLSAEILAANGDVIKKNNASLAGLVPHSDIPSNGVVLPIALAGLLREQRDDFKAEIECVHSALTESTKTASVLRRRSFRLASILVARNTKLHTFLADHTRAAVHSLSLRRLISDRELCVLSIKTENDELKSRLAVLEQVSDLRSEEMSRGRRRAFRLASRVMTRDKRIRLLGEAREQAINDLDSLNQLLRSSEADVAFVVGRIEEEVTAFDLALPSSCCSDLKNEDISKSTYDPCAWVDRLGLRLRDHCANITRIKSENSHLSSQISSLERDRSRLTAATEAADKKTQLLSTKKTEAEEQLEETKSQLLALGNSLLEQTRSHNRLEEEWNHARNNLEAQLSQNRSQMQVASGNHETIVQHLQDQIQSGVVARQRLSSDLSQAQAELADAARNHNAQVAEFVRLSEKDAQSRRELEKQLSVTTETLERTQRDNDRSESQLKSRIKTLESEVSNAENRASSVQTSLHNATVEHNQRLAELRAREEGLAQECVNLKSELTSVQHNALSTSRDADQERQKLAQSIEELQATMTNMALREIETSDQRDALVREKQELDAAIASLSQALSESQQREMSFSQELDFLRNQLAEAEQKSVGLETQLVQKGVDHDESVAKLETKLTRHLSDNESLSRSLSILRQELASSEDVIRSAHRRHQLASTEIQEFETALNASKAELSTAREQASEELNASLAEQDRLQAELQAASQSLENTKESHAIQLSSLQTELDEKIKELELAHDAKLEAETKRDSLTDVLVSLEKERSCLQQLLDNAITAAKTSDQTTEALQLAINQQLAELSSKLQQHEDAHNDQVATIMQLERDIESKTNDLVVSEKSKIDLEAQIQSLHAKVEETQREVEMAVSGATTSAQEYREQIDQLLSEKTELQSGVETLKEELTSLLNGRFEIAQKVAIERVEIEAKVASLEKALSSKTDELAENQRRADSAALKYSTDITKSQSRHLQLVLTHGEEMDEAQSRYDGIVLAHGAELAAKQREVDAILQRHAEELTKSQDRYDDLVSAHAADMAVKRRDVDGILERHALQMTEARSRHDELVSTHASEVGELQDRYEKLVSSHAEETETSKAQHDAQIFQHVEELVQLQTRYDELVSAHADEVSESKSRYNDLLSKHADELTDAKNRYDELVSKHAEELGAAQSRYDELALKHTAEIEAKECDIDAILERHSVELAKLKAKHDKVVSTQAAVLDAKQRYIDDILKRHAVELTESQAKYDSVVSMHAAEIEAKQRDIDAILERHAVELTESQAKYDSFVSTQAAMLAMKQHDIDVILERHAVELTESQAKHDKLVSTHAAVLDVKQRSIDTILEQHADEVSKSQSRYDELVARHSTELEAKQQDVDALLERHAGELENSQSRYDELASAHSTELEAKQRDVDAILKRHAEELEKSQSRYDELATAHVVEMEAKQRDWDGVVKAHAEEIEKIQGMSVALVSKHATELESLQASISSLERQIATDLTEKQHLGVAILRLKSSHEESTTRLKQSHEESTSQLKSTHEELTSQLRSSHDERIKDLTVSWDKTVEEKSELDRELGDVRARFDEFQKQSAEAKAAHDLEISRSTDKTKQLEEDLKASAKLREKEVDALQRLVEDFVAQNKADSAAFRSQVAQLNSKETVLNETIRMKDSEIAMLRREVTAKLEAAFRQAETLASEKTRYESVLTTLRVQLDDAVNAQKKTETLARCRENELETEIAAGQSRIESLSKLVDQFQKMGADHDVRASNAEKTIRELEEQLERMTDSRDGLREKASGLEDDNAELEHRLKSADEAVAGLDGLISVLRDHVSVLECQLESVKAEIVSEKLLKDHAETKLETTSTRVSDLEKKVIEHAENASTSAEKLAQSVRENADLSKRLEESDEAVELARRQLEATELQLELTSETIAKLEKLLETSEESLNSVGDVTALAGEQLDSFIAESELQLAEVTRKSSVRRRNLDKAMREIAELRTTNKDLKREREELLNRVDGLEGEVASLMPKVRQPGRLVGPSGASIATPPPSSPSHSVYAHDSTGTLHHGEADRKDSGSTPGTMTAPASAAPSMTSGVVPMTPIKSPNHARLSRLSLSRWRSQRRSGSKGATAQLASFDEKGMAKPGVGVVTTATGQLTPAQTPLPTPGFNIRTLSDGIKSMTDPTASILSPPMTAKGKGKSVVLVTDHPDEEDEGVEEERETAGQDDGAIAAAVISNAGTTGSSAFNSPSKSSSSANRAYALSWRRSRRIIASESSSDSEVGGVFGDRVGSRPSPSPGPGSALVVSPGRSQSVSHVGGYVPSGTRHGSPLSSKEIKAPPTTEQVTGPARGLFFSRKKGQIVTVDADVSKEQRDPVDALALRSPTTTAAAGVCSHCSAGLGHHQVVTTPAASLGTIPVLAPSPAFGSAPRLSELDTAATNEFLNHQQQLHSQSLSSARVMSPPPSQQQLAGAGLLSPSRSGRKGMVARMFSA